MCKDEKYVCSGALARCIAEGVEVAGHLIAMSKNALVAQSHFGVLLNQASV